MSVTVAFYAICWTIFVFIIINACSGLLKVTYNSVTMKNLNTKSAYSVAA